MRYVYLVTFFIVVFAIGALGFRGSVSSRPPLEVFPDMDRQPRYEPLGASDFFADGRAARPIPAGVVARGELHTDSHFATGRTANGEWAVGFPEEITVDYALMERGRERFTIYCAPCHGDLGNGSGIVVAYGGATANFHSDPIRALSEGQIFATITNGKVTNGVRTMFPYGDKIKPADRWAVVAYVRALQRAHRGTVNDVPQSHKAELGIQ